MPLETQYKNPEVILTTGATPKQQEYVKNLKCIGLVLVTYFLLAFTIQESFLLSISVFVLLVGLVLMVMNRPRIIMNSIKKYVQVSGRDGSQQFQFPPSQVDKIMVKAKRIKGHRHDAVENIPGAAAQPEKKKKPDTWYYTQIFLKDPSMKKRRRKKGERTLESFELQDIVEAHYVAQLISAFTGATAFDVTGKMLPPVKSHIPTKYLKQD